MGRDDLLLLVAIGFAVSLALAGRLLPVAVGLAKPLALSRHSMSVPPLCRWEGFDVGGCLGCVSLYGGCL